jgi:hypothetical protein
MEFLINVLVIVVLMLGLFPDLRQLIVNLLKEVV